MKHLENLKNVNLLIWETVESKRNVNNVIQFYVDKGIEIEICDIIIGTYNTDFFGGYKIEEIIEKREGNMKGKIHITARINWQYYPLTDLKNVNQEYLSLSIVKAIK